VTNVVFVTVYVNFFVVIQQSGPFLLSGPGPLGSAQMSIWPVYLWCWARGVGLVRMFTSVNIHHVYVHMYILKQKYFMLFVIIVIFSQCLWQC